MTEHDTADGDPVGTVPAAHSSVQDGTMGAATSAAVAVAEAVDHAGPDAGGPGLVPGGVITRRSVPPFEVHLDVFQGPFDLLLGLIAKHKLDITEVALAQVTDEFVAHIKAAQAADHDWDLSQASEFLLVAATLLDIKAARLLPQSGPDDDEDLALIEARDLLFARLLQYRAYKLIAATFQDRMATAGRLTPRQAGLDPEFASLLPELVIAVTPEQFARIAARAMMPRIPPTVGLDHLHAPQVSVREQAAIIVGRLRVHKQISFRALVADADTTLVIVARFLALLELFKEAAIAFEQAEALGELDVRWTGSDEGAIDIDDEFDEEPEDDSVPDRVPAAPELTSDHASPPAETPDPTSEEAADE